MLPAANRLRSSADFRQTTRHGRKSAGPNVVVYMLPGSGVTPPVFGTVTGKVVGNSVQRHRAARRMRAAAARDISLFPNGFQVVLRALPGADRSPDLADQIHVAIEKLLARTTGVL